MFLYRSILDGMDEYEGRVLEDYFRTRIREEWTYTEVAGYWTRDGTVGVDIVVCDDIDRKAHTIEVKGNPKKMDMNDLIVKGSRTASDLKGYEVTYAGLSMDDVLKDPL